MMAVMLAVIFHGMTSAHHFAAQVRVARGFFSDAEKAGPDSVTVKYVQHLRSDDGVWAVVDGQGDFISGGSGCRESCPVRPQPMAACLLYTSPSPRDGLLTRMPS